MQDKVIFNDGQDVDPSDFNNLQTYAQTALDTLVADAVSAGQRYAGLNVTKSSVTAIAVGAGRLYSNGKVFAYNNTTAQDFIGELPVAGNKIVTVVAYGTEVDTDVTPREFLINETTGQSQPKPVATRHARVCNVTYAYGAEAPSPTAPIVAAGYTAVADILLTPTGVSTITMRDTNAVISLDGFDDRLDDLETFEGEIGPKVTTLSSDLASLSQKLAGQVSTQVLGQLLVRVASLESKTGIPTTAASSHADYFLDASKLDLANPLSSCTQNEGIRFPLANANQSQLSLFNPLDVNAKLTGTGLLFPAYTRKLWLNTGTQSDQVRISSYSYQTNTLVQKTMTQQVTQYGAAFDVCTNSAFWNSGTYDPISGIFKQGGNTYLAQLDISGLPYIYDADGYMHVPVRLEQYWTDTVTTPYWDTVTTNHQVNGAFVAETFLQGQDIWLDAVGLYFTKLADAGDATVAILEVSSATGLPDVSSAISVTNLPRASMQIAPTETQVSITPTFLQAGKRYAVAVITSADHWLATVPGEQFTAGTFFYILDGAYAQGDGTKDLQMNLYRAVPNSTRTSIQLNPLSLDGGILGIQINAQTWVPGQCNLSYEIQVNGNWYALSDVDSYTLGQGGAVLPLLPLRVTFVNSSDMMAAVSLAGSVCKVSRPGVIAKAFMLPVQLPAPSSQIHVIQRYENWDVNYHTANVVLRTGGTYGTAQGASTSYTTLVNASSFSDVKGSDPVAGAFIERTYVFNLGTAVSSFVLEMDLTTQTNLKQFHIAFHKDYEL